MSRVPKEGDIVICDFTHGAKGSEIKFERPALVVSSEEFNRKLGRLAWVCPITKGSAKVAKSTGYAVDLKRSCKKTKGFVLVNQLRSIDLKERNAKVVDGVNKDALNELLDDVHSRILTAVGM